MPRPRANGAGQSFRGFALLLRGRSGLTQRAMATSLGVSERAIQRWESGFSYPSAVHLKDLIALYVHRGVFSAGFEEEEAETLWELVRADGPHHTPPFDAAWFATLRGTAPVVPTDPVSLGATDQAPPTLDTDIPPRLPISAIIRGTASWISASGTTTSLPVMITADIPSTAPIQPGPHDAGAPPAAFPLTALIPPTTAQATLPNLPSQQSWGGAPDVSRFTGRLRERDVLTRWLLDDHCRVVAVLGLAGLGKTALATVIAKAVAPHFEWVYWRSLHNAPPFTEGLAGVFSSLGLPHPPGLPTSITAQVELLLEALRARRCLLVLDNWDAVLQPGEPVGRYRAGAEGYGLVLHYLSRSDHQSCLVLTSTEKPLELPLEDAPAPVRTLRLAGLNTEEGRRLLHDTAIEGTITDWQALVRLYDGNPLALKMVAETIREVFSGKIAAFLASVSATDGAIFGGLRRLMDTQYDRLSSLEQTLLTWLAIERGPVGFAELVADLEPMVARSRVLEGLEALAHRSVLEQGEHKATVTLLPVVQEYFTERLISAALHDIYAGTSTTLSRYALVKATAMEEVRLCQERLIATPLLERLVSTSGGRQQAEQQLVALLAIWRGLPAAEQGYGPGNVVNLLRLLRGDVWGLDLSRLTIRQAYLQDVEAQDARLTDALLMECVLADSFGYALSVALNAEGEYLAAGTIDGAVRLWRVADRALLLAVQGHAGLVWSVALSPDGLVLASGGDDGTIRLWDSAPTSPSIGTNRAILDGHPGGVWTVAFSPEGLLASSGADGRICLWDVAPAKEPPGTNRAILDGHPGGAWTLAFSPDGLLASGGTDGLIRLWDRKTGECRATLAGHTGAISTLACSAAGLLASGGSDGTIRLWETGTGTCRAIQQAHAGPVRSVALSTDGQLLASGGMDGLIHLWETGTGACQATLHGHTGAVRSVALSPDGRIVAGSGVDATIRLWATSTGAFQQFLQGNTGGIRAVALSTDGQLLASGGLDGTVHLRETATSTSRAILRERVGAVGGVALSADGRLLASGHADGMIRLWDVDRMMCQAVLQGHTGVIWSVAFAASGLLASGGVDGTIRLWDTETGVCRTTLQGHTGAIWSVALSTDGQLLASGGLDGLIWLWDTTTAGGSPGSVRATLPGHIGGVRSVALSADGQLLASGGIDALVRLWDISAISAGDPDTGAARPDGSSGILLATLEGQGSWVRTVALSADGSVLASAGLDGLILLWDTAPAHPAEPNLHGASPSRFQDARRASLRGHTGAVWSLALSADGRLLISGGADGTVRMWETATGTCLRILRRDRCYERIDITGLSGVTKAQRAALLALGAVDRERT